MRAPDVIVFDVDGVLVDVTASYREAVRETVRVLTGDVISNDLIQDYKNQGGWNNDWELTHKLVLDRGKKIEYDGLVLEFNKIFFGDNANGLILQEKWLPKNGFFPYLQERSQVAIFTGRVGYELTPTLNRFAPDVEFEAIVTADDVKNQKPAPDGLQMIQARHPGSTIWYLGDTVDDARAAKSAGVPFIGVASKAAPRHEELAERLSALGAITILNDVNELLHLIPESSDGSR